MDGPNVIWSAFDKLHKKVETENNFQSINIGSCGLQKLHNAFRAGMCETGWDISHQLSSLYYLFDETPARRDDFERVTDSSVYPLRFCSDRWVENGKVCERALTMVGSVQCYIENVQKKACTDPGNKSFDAVKDWAKAPFNKAELKFTMSIAKPVETLLTVYQTDRCMCPFLDKDLEKLLRKLMSRYI